jgi:hypothetical protein
MRPTYSTPAHLGRGAGTIDETTKQYDGIVYMPCNPENDFFPELALAKVCTHMPTRPRAVRLTSCIRLLCAQDSDIIYFCNPNNPTGACANREQITQLVNFAKEHGSYPPSAPRHASKAQRVCVCGGARAPALTARRDALPSGGGGGDTGGVELAR